jgi:isoquinoline 1-oxidoreductase alpha subunit
MIELTVNGEKYSTEADGDMPLLWYLRDIANLTGTKFGCGAGLCGACTVHLDGKAQRSCSIPLADAANREVTTIEGLSADGDHPVQQAWARHQVPQCGYCQSGMIMAVSALLTENPNPDADTIDSSISNVCRCGTYPRVSKAIQALIADNAADDDPRAQGESV